MKNLRTKNWLTALACILVLGGAACAVMLRFGPMLRDLLSVGLKTVVKLQ